ncbi:MAG: tetratricopeptide repeat protein [Lachnospiraceae bacterium]|nr:tetratricopeptide repeat protein [Lachnospiraceae bacterium]
MFCEKCGAQLNEDEQFCYKCGTAVASFGEKEHIAKKRRTGLILTALILLAVLSAVILICLLLSGGKDRKYEKQLALAERYLDELDYDQAILAYRGAIRIDPKKAEAYLSLAEIYEETGDLNAAEEILKEGYEQTEDEEIEEYLLTIQKLISGADETDPDGNSGNEQEEETIIEKLEPEWENIEPAGFPEADSLVAFLNRYSLSMSEYDHSNALKYDLLDLIVDVASCVNSYPSSHRPDEDRSQKEADPLGWFMAGYYGIYYEDDVDGILLNIFNCTLDDINKMKEDWREPQENKHGYKYLLNGKYYYGIAGGTDYFPRVDLVDIKEKEDHYRVVYETHYYVMGGYEEVHLSFYEAEMEWKLIDGSRYWSIYTDKEIDESREGNEWLTDWLLTDNEPDPDISAEEVVQAYAENIRNFGYYNEEYKVYCIYLNDDLIPEAIYDYGTGMDTLLLSYNGSAVRATYIDRDELLYFEKQNLLIEERKLKGIQTLTAKRIRNGEMTIIGRWAATEQDIEELWGYERAGQAAYKRMRERYFAATEGNGTYYDATAAQRSSKMGDLEAVTAAWEDLKDRMGSR